MKKKWMKVELPLGLVKLLCMAAVIVGIFFVVAGSLIAGLCMLLGAYILEKHNYCCPGCHGKLDMKRPLRKGTRCPICQSLLRR